MEKRQIQENIKSERRRRDGKENNEAENVSQKAAYEEEERKMGR